MPKILVVSDAEPEEQGNFCDTNSRYVYNNVDDFTKNQIVDNAEQNGVEVLALDDPIPYQRADGGWKESPVKPVEQRHSITLVETDDQGVWHAPKHGPGR